MRIRIQLYEWHNLIIQTILRCYTPFDFNIIRVKLSKITTDRFSCIFLSLVQKK